jgi:hypothetical protein
MRALLGLLLATSASAGYYDPFLYRVNGDCSHIEAMQFEENYSWGLAYLGGDAYAGVTLQIFSDHTYWARYDEVTPVSETQYDETFSKTLSGHWKLDGDRIAFSGLGYGAPAKYVTEEGKAYDSIGLRVTRVIHDPRVVRSAMNVAQAWGNDGPRGETAAQYCGH